MMMALEGTAGAASVDCLGVCAAGKKTVRDGGRRSVDVVWVVLEHCARADLDARAQEGEADRRRAEEEPPEQLGQGGRSVSRGEGGGVGGRKLG